jgi:hypothetical protein
VPDQHQRVIELVRSGSAGGTTLTGSGVRARDTATCDARGAAYSRNVDTADLVGPLYSTIKLAI